MQPAALLGFLVTAAVAGFIVSYAEAESKGVKREGGVKGGVKGGDSDGVKGVKTEGGVKGGVKGADSGGVKGGVKGADSGGVKGGVKGGDSDGVKGGVKGADSGGVKDGVKGGASGGSKEGSDLAENASPLNKDKTNGGAGGAGVLLMGDSYGDANLEKEQRQHAKARRNDQAPLVCFLSGEAFERPGASRFSTSAVPVEKCTHVVYSYLETHNGTGRFIFRKRGSQTEKKLLHALASLKKRNPKLKLLFSYGGGAHMNSLLKRLRSKKAEGDIVEWILHWIHEFGMDGVNFHLEGPGPSVCNKKDVFKLLKFIKTLRRRFGTRDLLITTQLPACRDPKCDGIPKDALAKYVDYLFLMTFDYKLDDLSKTKLTSGLYFYEGDRKTAIESESCLGRWVDAGVPKFKIVPGIATYGRSFTLDNPAYNGVSAKLNKRHPLGYGANFTKTDGYMNYVETCRRVKYHHWKREWVKYAATPYIYYKDQWISYDDVDSVDVKAKWFRSHWFGGIFVWTLDADDYGGDCVGELFPMVDAAWKALRGYRPLQGALARAFICNCTWDKPTHKPWPRPSKPPKTTPRPSTTTESTPESTTGPTTESTPESTTGSTPESTTETATRRTKPTKPPRPPQKPSCCLVCGGQQVKS